MEHTIPHSPNGAGHEQREVSVRLIVVSLGFLAVGTFFVFLLVVGIFRYFYDTDKTAESRRQGVVPPEPRIEVAPYEQIQQLRAHEDHILNSYAWVDKSAGTVRVPISRAIDMLAAKGLPSHNYLDDILAGKKPAAAGSPPAGSPPAGQAKQGSSNAK
jgi:hypothetical protein